MKLKLSITFKLAIFITLVVTLTATIISQVYFSGSSKIVLDGVLDSLEQEVELSRIPVADSIQQLRNDIILLEQWPPVQGIVRARSNHGVDPTTGISEKEWFSRLENMFEALLKTRPGYTQIRVIGVENNGKELLDLVRAGDKIIRTPDSELELQGKQDYFQETVKLAAGNIYYSEINLKREHGEVIYPYQLTLRVAIPLKDSKNETIGIIIINDDYNSILNAINKEVHKASTLYVANEQGDYLIHPDKSKLYGSNLGHSYRIQSDYPQILKIDNVDDNNAHSILPESHDGNVISMLKYHYDQLNPERYITFLVQTPYSHVVSQIEELKFRSYITSAAITLAAILISILFLRILMRPLGYIANSIILYSKGEKDVVLPTDSPDEIGVMAKEFKKMIVIKNNEDWIKENMVSISKELLGYKELKTFADRLMYLLANASGAHVGVLYIDHSYLEKEVTPNGQFLSLLGSYGYEDGKNIPASFSYGEGLVGLCASEKKEKIITDIPKESLRISSGLSDSKPNNLFLLPVLFENRLVAVIELASLNNFSEIQTAFLKQITFNIGVIIQTISASMRTEELLEEARATAEELRRNEEELKTQQEELQASNEELEENTRSLEEQNLKIKKQSAELEESQNLIEEKVAELESANKYKSEFLANISHELRTPLNSLLILAKSLSDNEEGNLTNEQIEEASVIYNGGLELLNLINDILDLSKVEAGKISIIPANVSLQDVGRDLSKQFEPVIDKSKVAFNVEIDEKLDDEIYTDDQRLEQILKNLLSNAFKFTEKGSVTLKIYPPSNDVNLKREGLENKNSIAFSVIDTGIGIAVDKLQDIFEAFQQEDGSTDRHYGGTGLGLTISRKFAHLLGGEIHVESTKGIGSKFTLYLPLRMDENEFEEKKTVKKSNPQPAKAIIKNTESKLAPTKNINKAQRRLLIIEDDKEFAHILAKQAEAHGYKSIMAHDGKAGLLTASQQQVDAIILDLRLPDIDGISILEQLKGDMSLRHIPVHVITGRADNDNKEILRKGAIGCLTKPVSTEDIDHVFAKIEPLLGDSVKTVLVVEDDNNTQAAIKKILGKKDLEITSANSGKKAFAAMDKQKFDCVILDLILPDMNGFEWLQNLEEREDSYNAPPVVIYTAKDLTEEENRKLNQYTGSIVIKGANSSDRLLDEVTLFLHSIESTFSEEQKKIIRMQHNPDKVLQGKKILLTDDDLRNTFALSKLLKKHGMEVIIADNGEMALEKLSTEKNIELILMDIMMPIMDGYQTITEIRKRDHVKHLPIIALTARAMPEEQEKCIEAGANDYLTKPVDIEKLLTLMRVLLFKQEKVA